MQLAITLKHHDHDYVELRGGLPLLTHLRGAPARAEYRSKAIDRALDRFRAAESDGRPEPEIGGLGLLVLQRAVLAAEDLGGLLHAFGGPDPWTRLRTSKIPDLDSAFERAVRDVERTLEDAFRLAPLEVLADEYADPQELLALTRLRSRAVWRWRAMLLRAARLWLSLQKIAKGTMHGFPLVAEQHVLGTPPAGELADNLPPRPPGRFALAMLSRETPPRDGTAGHVHTETICVPLDAHTVVQYRNDARATLRLYVELCESQAGSIMSRHGFTVPTKPSLVATLPQPDRAVLEALAAEDRDDGR